MNSKEESSLVKMSFRLSLNPAPLGFQEIMIDLETASTQFNAAILTIGAIKFNSYDSKCKDKLEEMNTFYRRIDLASQVNCHVDPKTMEWWQSQSEDAKNEVFGNDSNRIPIQQALTEFASWIGNKETVVWANGTDFDCTILRESYRLIGKELPWKFWNQRDTRTVYALADVRLKNHVGKDSQKHHALYDCYSQIQALRTSLVALGFV